MVRSYAIWELEYRLAFDKKALPVKELPKVDRSRWTMAGAEAEIRRRMEEQDQGASSTAHRGEEETR